jgi:hypothetical protein
MHGSPQAGVFKIHNGFVVSNAGIEGFFTFSNISHWCPGVAKLIFQTADVW